MHDVTPASALRHCWFGRHDVAFILKWLIVLAVVNLVIVSILPTGEDESIVKLQKNFAPILKHYEERHLQSSIGTEGVPSMPYRLMKPDIETGVKYPLVVFLHGAGERGADNLRQLTMLPLQMAQEEWRQWLPCFLVAPQCPIHSNWNSPDMRDDVVTMIASTLNENRAIDAKRIYLTGLSMGGYGCWMLAAYRPGLFAAVVPICGGGKVDEALKLVHTPLWAIHGDIDTAVPVTASREMIEAIRKAGGRPHYTELKGIGHDCWTQTYRDPTGVLAWMFAQARP